VGFFGGEGGGGFTQPHKTLTLRRFFRKGYDSPFSVPPYLLSIRPGDPFPLFFISTIPFAFFFLW